MLRRSAELGIRDPDALRCLGELAGWETAVSGGALSAEHLTYTPDEEIRAVGETDTVAVLLPQAELVYMTDRRANARLFIDTGVPVAIATDYCSSIHATSLTGHHRARRAVVPDHAGRGDRGRDAQRRLRPARRRRPRLDRSGQARRPHDPVRRPSRGAVPGRRPGRRLRGGHRRRGGARRRVRSPTPPPSEEAHGPPAHPPVQHPRHLSRAEAGQRPGSGRGRGQHRVPARPGRPGPRHRRERGDRRRRRRRPSRR